MRTDIAKYLVPVVASCALLVLGSPVFAASSWSNLGSNCGTTGGSGVPFGNVLSCGTQSGVTLAADAFSTSNGATSTTGTTFAAAALYNWGSSYGLGVVNRYENPSATGPHASDNQYGTDAVRLSFSSAVTLTSVGVGWVGGDSDLSLLAWTGTGAPGDIAGTTLTGTAGTSSLLNGWTVVGNYANTGSLPGKLATVSSSIYSSYWLVSAYNSAFGAGAGLDASTKDYFKLLAVAGNTQPPSNQTPEPGSLVLLGVGLLSMVASRHRRQKAR